MNLRVLFYALWYLQPLGLTLLAAVMVRRNLRRQFPMFFSYVLFQIVSVSAGLYLMRQSYKLYFLGYWTSAAISAILSFLVIHEIFSHVFRPYEALHQLGRVLFRWAMLVLILVAALMTSTANPHGGASALVAGIVNLERSIRMMQCGLVLLMLLFASFVGLSVRNHIFGIAMGFGLYASADMIGTAVRLRSGKSSETLTNIALMVTYNVTLAVWTTYLLRRDPARVITQPLVIEADRWNYALSGVTHPGGNEPSLPLIEDAVDRIMNRTNGRNGETQH